MRFFKSIRWRLQVWYGVLFLLMLSGFGFTAWHLESASRLQQVDANLHRRLAIMTEALKRGRGPPGERQTARPIALNLSPQEAAFFGQKEDSQYYYVVWLRNGPPVTRSAGAPADAPDPRGGTPQLRQRGDFRETFVFPAPDDCILVGLRIDGVHAELRRLAWLLAVLGTGVLAAGLAGGWWLTAHVLRPIQDITQTAARISKGNLSQRINTSQTESELGELAQVLNATFARLDAAFAQQARFTSDAAHELRTPVAVLLTQTQMTLARPRPNEHYVETIEACQRVGQRMRRLIESLLELARLDAGSEPMCRREFDLAETAGDCLGLLAPLAEKRGVILRGDLPQTPYFGDPDRIAQVITNLLANAIQFCRDGGQVTLHCHSQEDAVVFVCADTGAGIAPEHLPHIFERFYRADQARTSTQDRTGLGLAISKSIVEAHQGSINVSSVSGQGTTVTVRLPKLEPHCA